MTTLPTTRTTASLVAAIALFVTACSANDSTLGNERARPGSGGSGGGASGGAGAGAGASGGSGTGGNLFDGGGGGGAGGSSPCGSTDTSADGDGDGYSAAQGDCNDCDPNTNPGAYDVGGNGFDEDCSGTADDEPAGCDQGLAIEGNDPLDAARSLGLCRLAKNGSWGVVSAAWTGPDGTPGTGVDPTTCSNATLGNQVPSTIPNPLSRGLLPKFGNVIKPRQGGSLVALSSGIAREGINHFSPMGEAMCTTGTAPAGFPKDSPDCQGVTTATDKTTLDAIALELTIKTPTNAHSFSFAFDFYTFEFPDYVCKKYNDFFVALLDSQNSATPADKNISFDSKGAPVSVNNAFVVVCDPEYGKITPKKFACPLGVAELGGTGFEQSQWGSDHAATSWLKTSAPIVPGETIKLRFAIWDMKDEMLDSTVLIDDFAWDSDPGSGGKPPVTIPAPK